MVDKFLSLIFSLFFCFNLFARPLNWKNKKPSLISPLRIDGIYIGDIWITPKGKELYLDGKQTTNLLNRIIKPKYIQKLNDLFKNKNYLTKTELKALGFSVNFDPNELIIYLKVPSIFRTKDSISIAEKFRPKGSIITQSDMSSFLNFNYSRYYTDGQYEQESLYNEFNLNVHTHILNMGGHYNSDNQAQKYKRDYTRYIYDFENKHSRLIIGDLNHNTIDLQDQITGAGITFQNDFSINPSLLRTNQNQYEIDLKLPSTVEIFLNGSRLYKGFHKAGKLDLQKLPLLVGLNDIKIVITDTNGKREEVSYNTNYHTDLLPYKISDYSINVLKQSVINDKGDLEYNDKSFFSGYYRYGLSKSLTYGLNHQQAQSNSLTGIELSKGINNSILSFKSSSSDYESKRRQSYFFQFQSLYSPTKYKTLPIKFNYRYYDKDFKSVLGNGSTVKDRFQINTSYHFSPRFTVGIGHQLQQHYDDQKKQFSILESVYRVSPFFTISVKGQKDHTTNTNNSAFISINWSESSRRLSGNHQYNTQGHNLQNQIHYHRKIDSNKLYLSGNYSKNFDKKSEDKRFMSNLETQSGAIKVDYLKTNSNEKSSLNLRFALAVTQDSFNLTPYINNSFLVIDSQSDSLLYLDSQKTENFSKDDEYIKNTLTPYSYNTFKLDVSELKAGEELANDRISIRPTYKSGSYYKVKVKQQISLFFKIKRRTKSSSFITGELRNKNHSVPFMSGKSSRVFIEDIKPGKYNIYIDTKNTFSTIEVPNKTGMINLGVIKIEK